MTTTLRVADVMTPDPLVLAEDQPLRTAALLLYHYGVGGAPVVDADGALVGVLSETDLVEKEARPRFGLGRAVREAWRRRDAVTVGDACSRPARTTLSEASLHDAARELLHHDVGRLVVVEDGRLAGIITRHDVLRALVRADEAISEAVQEVLDTLDEPAVAVTVEWGVVTLTGTVSTRSRMRPVTAHAAQVDGVMRVEVDQLGWREDDVTPLTLGLGR